MNGFIQSRLSYSKTEKSQFLSKRLCGVWLVWIGVVLIMSIVFSGNQPVNQLIFYVGYGAGMGLIFGNKTIRQKLSFGPPSEFQRKMTIFSIVLMFIFMFCLGGPFYATLDYKMIWLGVLMAVAIHFIPFSFVHGKSMIILSLCLMGIIILGYVDRTISFSIVGYLDASIKILFGLLLLLTKKPKEKLER